MLLYVLMGQRKCRYDGQYAPEALEVIDENGNDENPDFLVESRAKYEDSKEFDSLAVIRVQVSSAAVHAILTPKSPILEGHIV